MNSIYNRIKLIKILYFNVKKGASFKDMIKSKDLLL